MKETWFKKTDLDLDENLRAQLFPAIFTPPTHPRLSSFKEEVIIVALMHYDTAKSASKALKSSSSSMSKFLFHRHLDYVAIKTIQMFQGVSRRHVDKQTYSFNRALHTHYAVLNRLSRSKKEITNRYKQLMTQANGIGDKSNPHFFFYTCVIAAILSSETTEIVADKLNISESMLLRFLREKKTDFQSIKRIKSEMQQDTGGNAIGLDDKDIEDPSQFDDACHTPSTIESDALLSPWNSSEKSEMRQGLIAHSSISWCSLFSGNEDSEGCVLKKARTQAPSMLDDIDLLSETECDSAVPS